MAKKKQKFPDVMFVKLEEYSNTEKVFIAEDNLIDLAEKEPVDVAKYELVKVARLSTEIMFDEL
jgi:hypothetical protein